MAAESGAATEETGVFETDSWQTPVSEIDKLVLAAMKKEGLRPAPPCSDEIFLRRVHLDTIGMLPEPKDIRAFLRESSAAKRAAVVESLLKREEFADYWTMKWCDILRVKAEYPINLWPNGVQAYHRWIHNALRTNRTYDEFARELLTSSGSNFRTPAVNFYRALQGTEPEAIARATALTFMGARVDAWPEARRKGLEAFFSRVAYKGTAEWKEVIVFLDPAVNNPLKTVLPDNTAVTIQPGHDPREVFADWLISPDNPWFTRNIVNRVWSWVMGRGIIHEPDDMRPDNPPSHPALLDYLEKELVAADYDLHHIYRLILTSRIYQQSCVPRKPHKKAEELFACYPLRRLDAEVLIDALCTITGVGESYTSPIPEPFTFIPESRRSVRLADGSITSPFLEMFGRPPRDTGLESERNNAPSEKQRLHLLNSTHIKRKISRGRRLWLDVMKRQGEPREVVDHLYLTILSRYPTREEGLTISNYFQTPGINRRHAAEDLVWALINTKEFQYRH